MRAVVMAEPGAGEVLVRVVAATVVMATPAAAVTLAALTAYRAVVTQGQMQAGQNVLVTGIGGGAAGEGCDRVRPLRKSAQIAHRTRFPAR